MVEQPSPAPLAVSGHPWPPLCVSELGWNHGLWLRPFSAALGQRSAPAAHFTCPNPHLLFLLPPSQQPVMWASPRSSLVGEEMAQRAVPAHPERHGSHVAELAPQPPPASKSVLFPRHPRPFSTKAHLAFGHLGPNPSLQPTSRSFNSSDAHLPLC